MMTLDPPRPPTPLHELPNRIRTLEGPVRHDLDPLDNSDSPDRRDLAVVPIGVHRVLIGLLDRGHPLSLPLSIPTLG